MSDNKEFDYLFKILLIGNANTEKSSLLFRFTEDAFDDNFIPTIGVDFVSLIIYNNYI